MSLPAYTEYKDSRVEWLDKVPGHWGVTALKRFCDVRDGTHDTPEYVSPSDFSIPLVTSKDITAGEISFSQTKHISLADHQEISKRSGVSKGDILMPMIGTIGGAAIVSADDNFSIKNIALFKSGDFSTEWLKYLLDSDLSFNQFDLSRSGGVQGFVSLGALRNLTFPLPTIDEQKSIARFLDYETVRIDALIEEQQRLIELLKEKRQAVISHAVTKGLDPTVPMKDSGVEWLGEVPAHWDISNVKRIGTIRYGIGEPPQYHPEGMPLIRATNVHAGKLFSQGLVFVDPAEIPARRIVWLESGDIVVVRSGAYTGDSAIIPNEYGPCIAGFDMVLRCHSAQPDFIQFALLSKYLKEGQLDLEKMRAAQPHLNAEELGACMLVLPGMEEQIRIVEFLQMRCTEFDILMAEADQAKSLLQERRSALISAAVTGKIDVRGWQPPASVPTPELVQEAV